MHIYIYIHIHIYLYIHSCNINRIDSRLLVELAQLDNLLPHARHAVKIYIYLLYV